MRKIICPLLAVTLYFVSCHKKDVDVIQNKKLISTAISIEDLVSKVIGTKTTNDNQVVEAFFNWDSKSKMCILEKINVRESNSDDFAFGFAAGFNSDSEPSARSGESENLRVSCSVNCDGCSGTARGAFAAGRIAQKCIDGGGCATVCREKMTFNPVDRTLIVSRDDKEQKQE